MIRNAATITGTIFSYVTPNYGILNFIFMRPLMYVGKSPSKDTTRLWACMTLSSHGIHFWFFKLKQKSMLCRATLCN
jgi:hypothetical protein